MREVLELLPQPAFREDPLRAEVPEDCGRVAVAVNQGNATLFLGAGASAALPTDLPTGPRLAKTLVQVLSDQGIDIVALVENADDLGEVAAVVEGRVGRPALVNLIRESAPWDRANFNLAHLAAAILMAEGLLGRVLTLNWDRKILEAGRILHASALVSAFDADSLSAATVPMYVQLHGQLEQPASLVATGADLESHGNLDWAEAMLRAALAETGLVLVGFGAEPQYVLASLEWAIGVAAEPPLAVVSDKAHAEFVVDSPRLANASGVAASADRYVQRDAAQLLGEVLRSIYQAKARAALVRATERATTVAGDRLTISEQAIGSVRAWVLDRPLIDLLELLWRGNALSEGAPNQALLPTLGAQENALVNVFAGTVLLGSASDVTDIMPKGPGILLKTGETAVDLWPVVPAADMSASQAMSAVAYNADSFSSAPDAPLPLVLLIGGTWGAVPVGGRISLREEPPAENIAAGRRFPSDAVTLETLQGRIETFDHPAGQPSLRNLVEFEGGR